MNNFDVIIIGLGVNGSSAAWQLSKTGLSVCAIDQFRPPHTRGSSHGQSRIIRQAYYEHPLYVPLLQEAYPIWDDIQNVSGKKLFLKTGGLMLGSASAAVIAGSRLSAETHGIEYEYLNKDQITARFPAFRPAEQTVGVLEKEAGILFPEKCVETFLEQAAINGVELRYEEKVLTITTEQGAVTITTDKGVYTAGKLIVTAGAWLNDLVPDLDLPLVVERQVLFWFKNKDHDRQKYLLPDRLPVYIWEYEPGKMVYGFPDLGDGIKIAYHHAGREIVANELTSDVGAAEIEGIVSILKNYFNMDATFNYAATCMYTNTPDLHFIIDVHPMNNNIIVASPCSGHGFKFASLTGKILAQLATDDPVAFDLSPFSLSRFSKR